MRAIGKFFSALLSLLLCVILFASTLGFVGVHAVNRFFSPKVLDQITNELDLSAVMEQLGSSGESEQIALAVGKMTRDSALKGVLTDYLSGFWGYLVRDEGEFVLPELSPAAKKEFADLVIEVMVAEAAETEPSISEAEARSILEAQRSEIEESAAEAIQELLPPYREMRESMEFPQDALDALKLCSSAEVRRGLLLVAVVSLLLIALLRFSPYRWLIWGGITLLLCGLPLAAGAGVGLDALIVLAEPEPAVAGVLVLVVQIVKGIIMPYAIGLIGISVLMIVLYLIFRRVCGKKQEKAAGEETLQTL